MRKKKKGGDVFYQTSPAVNIACLGKHSIITHIYGGLIAPIIENGGLFMTAKGNKIQKIYRKIYRTSIYIYLGVLLCFKSLRSQTFTHVKNKAQ